MFKYCPSCACEKIEFSGRHFYCNACGFCYYHNTAAAAGCVIETDGRAVLLVRGKDPMKGKLDLPGGFIDPVEGVFEGLLRELQEELGWTPPNPGSLPLSAIFSLFASFPNVYPYKNIVYNTCDMFFKVSVPGLTEKSFTLEEPDIAGVLIKKPQEINPADLAFESTRRAIAAYVKS